MLDNVSPLLKTPVFTQSKTGVCTMTLHDEPSVLLSDFIYCSASLPLQPPQPPCFLEHARCTLTVGPLPSLFPLPGKALLDSCMAVLPPSHV